MEDNFNGTVNLDRDQEGEWNEFFQPWDEQSLSYTMAAEQLPACTSMILNSSGLNAVQSLNPAFYPISHADSSTTARTLPSMGLNSCLMNTYQPNTSSCQPTLGLEAADPLTDPLNANRSSLNAIVDAANLPSRTSAPPEESNLVRFSWLSTLVQSLHSHPGSYPASSLSFPRSLPDNVLGFAEQGSPASAASKPMNLNADLLQMGMSSLDDILGQMGHDFINYGGAGSLQEQLSNALNASNVNELGMGSASTSCILGASPRNYENIDSAQRNTFSTPASSVSSDGGMDDDSSSHEDTSNPLDQVDDFLMQSINTPLEHLSATATPLRSPDTTSSHAGAKAETSTAAPTSNIQDQLKKRASKPGRATKKPKRERGTKLAIKIQSDVEVLDDGYKWRKYGQKPVKNSPYPRSYYKCTDKHCNVKKHVERQAQEPEFVVATYEGIHNHSRPDQQLQALQTDMNATAYEHDSFKPFVPTAIKQNLSPLEILGIGSTSSMFQGEPQSMSIPLQPNISTAQTSLEPMDQGIFQSLFQGEPRTRSI